MLFMDVFCLSEGVLSRVYLHVDIVGLWMLNYGVVRKGWDLIFDGRWVDGKTGMGGEVFMLFWCG